ncbi:MULTISPECIES: hypothetical protein [unclassified Aureimonas]|uniref:hypothetical protein n=1 Tax=unclassified Aureimonas TaxID=2615206 RepID=UPI0007013242|nr:MULTISPECIES: hypothetical protein [unclassified Aureimonas]KQT52187.1 hypothetical protein ASG62_16140 [Aureimonas sp. Leaf427]KQT70580.1 hypothetical protein ASG54_21810 [Aureimonas sp. Leaf460]
MANRVVETKEFREAFRREIIACGDVSPEGKRRRNILGIGGRQLSISAGVDILGTLIRQFQDKGATLCRSQIDLLNPKGARRYVSEQMNAMASAKLSVGANPIETLHKSLGDLIVVARKTGRNVYISKASATALEIQCCIDLRIGKSNAQAERTEALTEHLKEGMVALGDRTVADAMVADVEQYFRAVDRAA